MHLLSYGKFKVPTLKKAMFIFPHPDDEITCAGTIAKMKTNNWEVYLLTLTKGSDDQDKMVRTNEWNRASP